MKLAGSSTGGMRPQAWLHSSPAARPRLHSSAHRSVLDFIYLQDRGKSGILRELTDQVDDIIHVKHLEQS